MGTRPCFSFSLSFLFLFLFLSLFSPPLLFRLTHAPPPLAPDSTLKRKSLKRGQLAKMDSKAESRNAESVYAEIRFTEKNPRPSEMLSHPPKTAKPVVYAELDLQVRKEVCRLRGLNPCRAGFPPCAPRLVSFLPSVALFLSLSLSLLFSWSSLSGHASAMSPPQPTPTFPLFSTGGGHQRRRQRANARVRHANQEKLGRPGPWQCRATPEARPLGTAVRGAARRAGPGTDFGQKPAQRANCLLKRVPPSHPSPTAAAKQAQQPGARAKAGIHSHALKFKQPGHGQKGDRRKGRKCGQRRRRWRRRLLRRHVGISPHLVTPPRLRASSGRAPFRCPIASVARRQPLIIGVFFRPACGAPSLCLWCRSFALASCSCLATAPAT